jgi:ABC-type sugar transport system permease subunit
VGTLLLLTVMLNAKRVKFCGFFRTGYYISEVTSTVSVVILSGSLKE